MSILSDSGPLLSEQTHRAYAGHLRSVQLSLSARSFDLDRGRKRCRHARCKNGQLCNDGRITCVTNRPIVSAINGLF